jgi:hypothetical protein
LPDLLAIQSQDFGRPGVVGFIIDLERSVHIMDGSSLAIADTPMEAL